MIMILKVESPGLWMMMIFIYRLHHMISFKLADSVSPVIKC